MKVVTEQNASPIGVYASIKEAKELNVEFDKFEGELSEFYEDEEYEKYINWVCEQIGCGREDLCFIHFEDEDGEPIEELWDLEEVSGFKFDLVEEFPDDSIIEHVGMTGGCLGHIEVMNLNKA